MRFAVSYGRVLLYRFLRGMGVVLRGNKSEVKHEVILVSSRAEQRFSIPHPEVIWHLDCYAGVASGKLHSVYAW